MTRDLDAAEFGGGEYAAFHPARHREPGDAHRTVLPDPGLAHGTNPASAQMAGKRWSGGLAANGDIDLDDFGPRPRRMRAELAACMITYPSTHGPEETVKRGSA